MKNNLKKMLVLLLAANMFAGATVPVFAEDSVTPGTTQETITNPDGTTTEITTTTTVTPGETEGTTDINIEIDKKTEGTTADGTKVEGEDHREETKTVDEEDTVISSSMREEGTETRTEEDGRVIESGYEGGSDMTTEENGVDNITVDVPLTDTDDPETEDAEENVNTVEGRPAGTETVIDGEKPAVPGEGDYDYTTETVVTPGKVTVETTEITVTETVDGENTDLEYVVSDTTPDGTNDLVDTETMRNYPGGVAPDAYLPGYEGETVIPEGVEGYEYVYVGTGNTSKFFPAITFDEPLTDEDKLALWGDGAYISSNLSKTYLNYFLKWLKPEDRERIAVNEDNSYKTDEEGYLLYTDGTRVMKEERVAVGPNGEPIYLHRVDNYGDSLSVEGWYENGEWIKDLNSKNEAGKDNKYTAIWAGPQQFILVDSEGNTITTYCADFTTPTVDTYGYNVENLEDATYYSDAEAEQIRSIALNGYWGTSSETGSLETMKQQMLASGKFTEEELASLNDGVALTATQMAIWSCSNKMSGLNFVNAHYSNWGTGDVPTEKEDEVKLMFKLYEYLMALDPTAAENEEGEKTTADTIINEDNFVKDMSITVIEKAEEHANNEDDNKDNDAYVTDVSFSLVVTPSTENGDDLIVKVIGTDGTLLASARIAGENKEGETYDMLTPDAEGNYKFEGITIIEGENTFNISLEGVQNLKHGVYLYTSEVREGTSSQTLVGLAEGTRGVNVKMDIKFDLNVEDEVVATEHVWHDEWERDPYDPEDEPEDPTPDPEPKDPKPEPKKPTPEPKKPEPKGKKYSFKVKIETEPEEIVEIPDEDIPLVDIPDEAIPLTDIPDEPIPQTGDSMFWYITGTLAALALSVLSLGKKGKKENA